MSRREDKFVGIQVGPISFVDEGVDQVLDHSDYRFVDLFDGFGNLLENRVRINPDGANSHDQSSTVGMMRTLMSTCSSSRIAASQLSTSSSLTPSGSAASMTIT